MDLIVETDSDFLALEIKAARNVSAVDTRGLQSFELLIKGRRPLRKWIIYRGPRKQKFENGVEAWPVLEALRNLT